MRKLSLILIFLLLIPPVFAHIPILETTNKILVEKPETSYAYYGILNDNNHIYSIKIEKPISLYLNLLYPYQKETPRIGFHLYDNKNFSIMYKNIIDWNKFYEEYGRDYYLKGPEIEINITPGNYYIEVFSENEKDKYVLAIGKKEEFGFFGILQTLIWLPIIKLFIFNKPLMISIYGIILFSFIFLIIKIKYSYKNKKN